jgi:hypothetical protein
VDEHGNLLVHRVGAEEEVALVLEVFRDVLVAQALEAECELHSQSIWARRAAEQLQLNTTSGSGHFLHS